MKTIIQFNQTDYQLTNEACDHLKALVRTPGWGVFSELLKKQFVVEYAKLRNHARSDEKYALIKGKLDGLEYALNVVDEELKTEIAHNPEKGEQEEN